MNSTLTQQILNDLEQAASAEKAIIYQRFFKTGPGQYGAGDQFMGVTVPLQQAIAKRYLTQASLADCAELLRSPWHEVRELGLALMVGLFSKSKDASLQAEVIALYEANFAQVNNWDLVDMSAPKLTGPWYLKRDRAALFNWVQSDHLWTKRIGIMSTFAFIRNGDFTTTLQLADILLRDPHDLMQKATGWMLRELGNRNGPLERQWLAGRAPGSEQARYRQMGRTMLRYAIEKFPKAEYQQWLKGQI